MWPTAIARDDIAPARCGAANKLDEQSSPTTRCAQYVTFCHSADRPLSLQCSAYPSAPSARSRQERPGFTSGETLDTGRVRVVSGHQRRTGVDLRMPPPDSLQPVMLVLLLSAVLLLLGTTVGALVLLWRTMNERDRVQRKLDWVLTPHDRRKTVAWPRRKAAT